MKFILPVKAMVKLMLEKDLPLHSKFIMWAFGILLLALACRLIGFDVDTVVQLFNVK